MAKEKLDWSKSQVNVATIGDIGHGKTTLTAALTDNGWDKSVSVGEVSSAANEQDRDETKALPVTARHVEYSTTKRHYAHVDCPGNADDIRSRIAGATELDAVILVVSAVDCPTPETREQVFLARQLKVPYPRGRVDQV